MAYENAINAIGSDEPGKDWQLRPQEHAASLPPEAGGLIRILQRPEVRELMGQFTRADGMAVSAQKTYKTLGRTALLLYAAGAIIGLIATGLIALNWARGILEHPLPEIFSDMGFQRYSDGILLLQYLIIITAMVAAQGVLVTRSFDNWMKARATAEIARIDLFHFITVAKEPARESELPVLPLKLEYFRRYQLDVQMRYYEGRGGQHAKSAGRLKARRRIYGLISTAIGLPALYVGGRLLLNNLGYDTQSQEFRDLNTVFYFVAALVPILLSTNKSLTLLSQDDRNASRYGQTFENLKHLKDQYLESARKAAEEGDYEGVLTFVDSVNEQISSEHREWISLSEDSLRHKFETISRLRLPNLPAKGE